MQATDRHLELSPYIGPRPFERRHRDRFYGRDQEKSDILSLIIANQIVVLYAESGTGKTSLLNAAVIPALETKYYEVLPLTRVRGLIPDEFSYSTIQNPYVLNSLISWSSKEANPSMLLTTTIPEFLNNRPHVRDEDEFDASRTVIFDQFEEIFTAYQERWEEREAFFKQLAKALDDDPLLHLVFVLREDYIGQLEPFGRIMPGGFRTRFRLERLRRPKALMAVVEPLKHFKSIQRSFASGVAEKLVEDLTTVRVQAEDGASISASGEYIEPVQLQVVCESLWRNLPPDTNIISDEHLQAFGDINQALSHFYETSLVQAIVKTHVKEDVLRNWFENTLITPAQTRGMAYQGVKDTMGISNEAVAVLQDQHMIRPETRAGGRWYELTHDRFIEPILRSNEAWRRKNAEATNREKNLLQEKTEVLEEQAIVLEKKASRRLQTLLVALFLFSIGAIILALFSFQERNIARDQELVALANAATATIAQGDAINQAATAQAAKSTSDANAVIAQNNAITATIAQGDAINQAATAQAAKSTSDVNASMAKNSAMTATLAQGDAINHAATAQAAKSTSDANAVIAQNNAIIATLAQGDAINQAATAQAAKSTSDANAVIAQNNAITATLAQGDAINQAATAQAAKSTSDANAVIAQNNAIIATIAQGDAINQAATAQAAKSTSDANAVIAQNNAITATLAQGDAINQAATAQAAKSTSDANATIAQGLSLAANSINEAALGDYDLALSLAIKAYQIAPAESAVNRALANAAAVPGTVRVFEGQTDGGRAIAFSPDGTIAASSSNDKMVILWNVTTGKIIKQLKGHSNSVQSLVFTADNKRLISGAWQEVFVWDVETGQKISQLLGTTGWVNDIVINPKNENQVAAGDGYGLLFLWDLQTGQIIHKFHQPNTKNIGINSVMFSQDGKKILTGNDNQKIILWNSQTGEETQIDVGSYITRATFNSDGSKIAAATYGKIIVWDTSNLKKPQITMQGHNDWVNSVRFAPGDRYAVSASTDQTIIFWDVKTGSAIWKLRHSTSIKNIVFSEDGRFFLSASDDHTVRLWLDPEATSQVSLKIDCGCPVSAIAYNPTGPTILGAIDNNLHLWTINPTIATGQEIKQFKGADKNWVNTAVFSPNGKYIASGSDDKTVILWEVSTENIVQTFRGHTDSVKSVVFSPDGKYIASGSDDKTVILWEVSTGNLIYSFKDHQDGIKSVAFSPNGKYIASASGSQIYLWDIATKSLILKMDGDKFASDTNSTTPGNANSIAFSPDGHSILAGYDHQMLLLWDVKSGQEIKQFLGHTGQIRSVAFSPDGTLATSGSNDKTVRLWSIESGQEVRRFEGHGDTVTGVSFSPDGNFVLSGSEDATIRLWKVQRNSAEIMDWVKTHRYIRPLTVSECSEFQISSSCGIDNS